MLGTAWLMLCPMKFVMDAEDAITVVKTYEAFVFTQRDSRLKFWRRDVVSAGVVALF